MLNRCPRSVTIVDRYLKMILCISDAETISGDNDTLFECVLMKFRLVRDLATSCRLPVQELLKHASPQIFSNITRLLLLN